MYRAGDHVLVRVGRHAGHVLEIASVRMFATDNGYYLHDGEGLYAPNQVELAQERAGNPCGTACDTRSHNLIGACDHCLGNCHHTH